MPATPAWDEAHIWCVNLDAAPDVSAALYSNLGADEQQRSARQRFEGDRRRYIVAHGALRHLLGYYLGTRPGDVRFVYNGFGKPALSPEFGSSLRFNLSHSGEFGLIAFAAGAEVGVDIERVRTAFDYRDIAQHPDPEAFFSWWTRKEACAKARGDGLGGDGGHPERSWSIYTLRPVTGYVGALAIERSDCRLRQWEWRC